MKRFIFAAALAGTAISGVAVAQNAAPAPQRDVAAADTNRVTTRAEALAAADARFDRLDSDKNGKLTAGEHRGRRGGAQVEMTREQFRERAAQRFDRVDTNKDGRIDAAERKAMRDQWKGKRGGRHGGGGMGMMMGADANRDGILTKAEALAATGAMFDRIDTNKDGRIDAAERQAARGAMKARGAPSGEARPVR
ncbi:hypothetical protein [Sphingomonas sp.]|jgi:Ca2+-binding EF-hand superfamily protein|uniref:hypothetical protein n=1 Tax=Sphingomonas sp. TaxID=28214 RepID=UPI00262DD30C|nr:hypothetical protein [Sphingomonas sp.]MDF2493309.1 hypothetical protein [Sphingomonas sp.]